MPENQLPSTIATLVLMQFIIYEKGSRTKYNKIIYVWKIAIDSCPCPNSEGMHHSKQEAKNSISQTIRVTLMFTWLCLRLLILVFSDSNLSNLDNESRSFLKVEHVVTKYFIIPAALQQCYLYEACCFETICVLTSEYVSMFCSIRSLRECWTTSV